MCYQYSVLSSAANVPSRGIFGQRDHHTKSPPMPVLGKLTLNLLLSLMGLCTTDEIFFRSFRFPFSVDRHCEEKSLRKLHNTKFQHRNIGKSDTGCVLSQLSPTNFN